MKRYFDIYLRRAATALDPNDIGVSNILDSFDRLELADAKAKLSLEPLTKELNDGTLYVDAEKGSFEAATLRVEKAEWQYLRQHFHNQKCDVLLYDPNDNTMLAVIYRLDMSITQVAESGESVMIKVSGTRSMSPAAAETAVGLLATLTDTALVSGTVFETDGVTPVAGVLVHFEDESNNSFEDTSDKDGYYLISLAAGVEYAITASKTGGWVFPDDLTVTPGKDMETVQNIVAETDAGS